MIGRRLRDSRGYIGMISILLALVLTGYLFYLMLSPSAPQQIAQNSLADTVKKHNIDTSSYQTVLESTKGEIKRLEQLQVQQAEEMNLFRLPGE